MWNNYYNVASIDDALELLSLNRDNARIVAGGTDLVLEIERHVRKGVETLIDISRVKGLNQIEIDENEVIHLGPLVTHNDCVASKLLVERAFPLVYASWQVGSPQIRNRGTVAGNLITASPANDTITPLMAMGASVTLRSRRGEREVPLSEFYLGVRKTIMEPDEMLVDISFPALQKNQKGTFYKFSLRRAQAISVVNASVLLTFTEENPNGEPSNKIESAVITLGSVSPKIIHAEEAENLLMGNELNEELIATAGELAQKAATPIDDVRGSAKYRKEMVKVTVERCLEAIWKGEERAEFPPQPPLLWGEKISSHWQTLSETVLHESNSIIKTIINGKSYEFESAQNKTLLHLLREDAGLIGPKEGCSEGECGACTVYLDGIAVMSCLVPAARAHNAEIVTIEGIGDDNHLSNVQQAFVEEGAVQCGYCTPGFIMSATKLLEEIPHPNELQIKHAITGNLCRCTGYYKIVRAIEKASKME